MLGALEVWSSSRLLAGMAPLRPGALMGGAHPLLRAVDGCGPCRPRGGAALHSRVWLDHTLILDLQLPLLVWDWGGVRTLTGGACPPFRAVMGYGPYVARGDVVLDAGNPEM